MRDIVLGSLGFFLFFLSDFNGVIWKKRWLQGCFPAGCLLLAAATADMLFGRRRPGLGAVGYLSLAAAALFLFMLIYTLFFAIPLGESYKSQQGGRRVIKSGVYALCRHPGVLWLMGGYLFLWLAFGETVLFVAFVVFSLLDIGYIVLQDWVIFPQMFEDYEEYRRQVPFLLPTLDSIAKCLRTWKG